MIIVTGGKSRFASTLKKLKSSKKFIFLDKKKLDIMSINSIEKNIKKFKPKIILHLAGFSRPMIDHEKNITKSIRFCIYAKCFT